MDSFYYFDDTPIKVMIKREHEQENTASPEQMANENL